MITLFNGNPCKIEHITVDDIHPDAIGFTRMWSSDNRIMGCGSSDLLGQYIDMKTGETLLNFVDRKHQKIFLVLSDTKNISIHHPLDDSLDTHNFIELPNDIFPIGIGRGVVHSITRTREGVLTINMYMFVENLKIGQDRSKTITPLSYINNNKQIRAITEYKTNVETTQYISIIGGYRTYQCKINVNKRIVVIVVSTYSQSSHVFTLTIKHTARFMVEPHIHYKDRTYIRFLTEDNKIINVNLARIIVNLDVYNLIISKVLHTHLIGDVAHIIYGYLLEVKL